VNVQVALSLNVSEPLTYEWRGDPAAAVVGTRLLVPLGNIVTSGWLWETASSYQGPAKPVLARLLNGYRPDPPFLGFVRTLAELFLVSPGMLCDFALPPSQKPLQLLRRLDGRPLPPLRVSAWPEPKDSGPLEVIIPKAADLRSAADLPEPFPDPVHLRVLGDARELEYRRLMQKHTGNGRSVLVLVPDRLTAEHWLDRLPGLVPYYADQRAREREEIWGRAMSGEAQAVVGSLSALFLPFHRLGAVIIERSGSSRYHSSFHAHMHLPEIARIRASGIDLAEGGWHGTLPVAEADASVQSLDSRPPDLAPVDIRPLSKGKRGIPEEVPECIAGHFADGLRTWVILPRKSSNLFLYCGQCRRIIPCAACEAPLVLKGGSPACLSCGEHPKGETICPRCQGKLDTIRELGIDSLSDLLRRRLGEEEVVTVGEADVKTWRRDLEEMDRHSIVLTSPTWMVPQMAGRFDRIVMVRPESLFRMNRFRSAERIFSTIAELRGLARIPGLVTVFSTYHFHYSLQLAGDEPTFWERERKYREWFRLPPYAAVFRITVRDRNLRALAAQMRRLRGEIGRSMHVARVSLAVRKPERGTYRGWLEIHGDPRELKRLGLKSRKGESVERVWE